MCYYYYYYYYYHYYCSNPLDFAQCLNKVRHLEITAFRSLAAGEKRKEGFLFRQINKPNNELFCPPGRVHPFLPEDGERTIFRPVEFLECNILVSERYKSSRIVDATAQRD
jgi:hypothetical protein